MKLSIALLALAGSAAAFAPSSTSSFKKSSALAAFTVDTIPGALSPMGLFDPFGFAERADEGELKRYRESELTHGRVAMLAVVGFLAGEAVEGSSFLFDSQVSGPAISHLAQVPPLFWGILTASIGAAELKRATIGWVEPQDVENDLLRENYLPGNLGFDPLGLKPANADEFFTMQTKELQNGRLAMLAAVGFMAQELVDGQGIVAHLLN
jgi:hypothetical protein